MSPSKRKAPTSSTIPASARNQNQSSSSSQMQLPNSPQNSRNPATANDAASPPSLPLNSTAQALLNHLNAPDLSAAYAAIPNLSHRVEFQTSDISDILVRKRENSEFILRGVFMIARNDFYMTPDGNYSPTNSFGKPFQDTKLSCRLASPASSTYPFAAADFPKCIDNLHSIEKLIKVAKGAEVMSSISECLGKTQFKISHTLFEAKTAVTAEGNDTVQSQTDGESSATETQIDDDDTQTDLGPEFAMQTWPVNPRNVDSLEELFETHNICPLPAYDRHDHLIPPIQYEDSLKGATVEVHFTLSHNRIKTANRHVYSGILRKMKVLEPPSALPSSPYKRLRVSAVGGARPSGSGSA